MYNSQNSSPRKGWGISKTHKCPNCGHEFALKKIPFMLECSVCKTALYSKDIVEINKKNENE